jgi:hypothetical protein
MRIVVLAVLMVAGSSSITSAAPWEIEGVEVRARVPACLTRAALRDGIRAFLQNDEAWLREVGCVALPQGLQGLGLEADPNVLRGRFTLPGGRGMTLYVPCDALQVKYKGGTITNGCPEDKVGKHVH